MEGKVTILLTAQKNIYKGQWAAETKEERDLSFMTCNLAMAKELRGLFLLLFLYRENGLREVK